MEKFRLIRIISFLGHKRDLEAYHDDMYFHVKPFLSGAMCHYLQRFSIAFSPLSVFVVL